MNDQQHPHDDQPPQDEDTRAILHRRRFLIESALAGIGAGAVLIGCDKKPAGSPKPCLSVKAPPQTQPKPQVCLEVEPRPCLSVAPSPATKPATRPEPQVCLSPPVPPPPTPCLKIVPPQPCLSPPAPKPCLKIIPPGPGSSGSIIG